MPFSLNNKTALAKQYKEPENGKYGDITDSVLGEMDSDSSDEDQ